MVGMVRSGSCKRVGEIRITGVGGLLDSWAAAIGAKLDTMTFHVASTTATGDSGLGFMAVRRGSAW
jgi:hypothetical protein